MGKNHDHKIIPFVFALMSFLLLTACASKSKLNMNSLASVSRGLSREEVAQRLAKKPSMNLTIEALTGTRVEVFDMVTGTETVYGSTYIAGVNGAPGYSIPTSHEVDITEPYFLLYHDDSLEFWGFLDEFGRSEDPEIRKYRPMISSAFEAEKERRNSQEEGGLY